jgi:hypothetical protein
MVTACVYCGELAEVLRVHRSTTATLLQRLPGAFRFPFTDDGLIACLALVVMLTFTSYLPVAGTLGGLGLFAAGLFGITRSTGRGSEQMEVGEYRDLLSSFVVLFRFLLVMAPLSLPLLVTTTGVLGLLLKVVLSLLALVWGPVAYLGAATETPLVLMANPVGALGLTLRVGRDSVVYIVAMVGLAVLSLVMLLPAALAWSVPVPLLSRLIATALVAWPSLVAARIAGLYLLLHGEKVGWSAPGDELAPALPDAKPRGVLPETSPAARVTRAPIELAPEPVVRASSASGATPGRFEALDSRAEPQALDASRLPPLEAQEERSADLDSGGPVLDAAQLPTREEQVLGELRMLLERRDTANALELVRGMTEALPLTAKESTTLARLAAADGDDALAERFFRGAAALAGPGQPGAQVVLARFLAERRAQPGEARALMEEVARRAPETAAGAFARTWLEAPRP